MAGIRHNRIKRIFAAVLIAMMCVAAFPVLGAPANAVSMNAKGKINDSGVNLRKSYSTSSSVVKVLSRNTAVTVTREIFTTSTSSSSTKRWYVVKAGDKAGYVRSDLVKITSWAGVSGYTTDAVNYRTGPDTTFSRIGTASNGTNLTILLMAKRPGGDLWYKVRVNGKTGYMHSAYVNIGTYGGGGEWSISSTFKSEFNKLVKAITPSPGKKLGRKATSGGSARVVYTFNDRNCKKMFAITGNGNVQVPQAFTFTGKQYYVLYGMENGQCIITYNANGKRVKVTKFPSNYGHLNGITWDPQTKLCYIFKGCQYTIYTWNPATGKFGSAKTPYSSSGVGYDPVTKQLYASSESYIRVYSADGRFTCKKSFPRCSRGSGYHVQDCGAYNGFVFHGVTRGSNRFENYLDVYRARDGKYLGSIKVTMDEIESVVIGSDGYIQLLINTAQRTDYVWKTPLNVKDLK